MSVHILAGAKKKKRSIPHDSPPAIFIAAAHAFFQTMHAKPLLPGKQRAAVRCTLLLNVAVLLAVVVLAVYFRDPDSRYFRIGPAPDLHVVSVVVDTASKYAAVVAILALVCITDVIIGEIAAPILGFNVYNPDKHRITEFGKLELQVLANAMFAASSIRAVFMLVVTVTQVDLALITVIVAECTSMVTIRWLLNQKTFGHDETTELLHAF